jgi:hypothetical protein
MNISSRPPPPYLCHTFQNVTLLSVACHNRLFGMRAKNGCLMPQNVKCELFAALSRTFVNWRQPEFGEGRGRQMQGHGHKSSCNDACCHLGMAVVQSMCLCCMHAWHIGWPPGLSHPRGVSKRCSSVARSSRATMRNALSSILGTSRFFTTDWYVANPNCQEGSIHVSVQLHFHATRRPPIASKPPLRVRCQAQIK